MNFKLTVLFLIFCFCSLSCSNTKQIIDINKTKTVKGIITDAYDIPQEGSEITVKNTNLKVFSDADGKFEIEATKGDILTIQLLDGNYDEIIITNQKVYTITLPNIIYGYGPFGNVE